MFQAIEPTILGLEKHLKITSGCREQFRRARFSWIRNKISLRGASCSYVTLFTKSPSFPKRANAYLKDKFGTPYEDAPSINSLHTSMFANSYNTYMKKYSFKL